MTRIKSIMWLLTVGLVFGMFVFGAPQSARAQSDNDHARTRKAKPDNLSAEDRKKVRITLERAREIALAKISGTVIEEELEKEDGRLLYSFDIRTSEGKVVDVEIDAETGAYVKIAEDDDNDDGDDDD